MTVVAKSMAVKAVSHEQRSALLQEISRHESAAKAAAQEGDLAESARCILLLLECERRVGGLGPQVLQLIKPRA
ncbi:hypothetical protein [Synechococcus sp. Lug-A]|uniref:hypothetical protein n=1 Tax=Synechococcus sp. Lug-A TaxID=2823740 RepID=UPI0020CBACC6|nr:hypothetical protein [Synechococcus sp. Lug-A]